MTQPILLVLSGGEKAVPEWRTHFGMAGAAVDVRWWDDATVDPAAVQYVLAWDPAPGRLAGYPNLKVIFSSGAGVDLIVRDPDLPRHVPVVRMATAGAAQRMGEYIAWAALSLLRGGRRIGIAQADRRWDTFDPHATAPDTTIGIMGLGHMGSMAARMLLGLGFPVMGWSRTRKDLPGVESFVGEAERDAFLARADILVCLLPATPETQGILAAPLFARLPRGAGLINAGRGSQQKIGDVIAALDSGQLSGAVLDVFEQEPLPPDHPAWAHPKLLVTAHIASTPPRSERAVHIAAQIAAHARGEKLSNIYDHARGY